jgi:hypothetical protein
MNRDDNTWNMVSSHDGTTLKINAHGSIEFTDDDADVKSISRGGYLTISKSTGRFFGDTQSFEARETGGTIERKYNVNGKTLTGDEGRAWLRTFLPELLREMAINADRRVARMLAKGGPASVLELVSSVKGEYAKGVYMRELYAQAALDAPTLSRSLQQAGAEISSDYDLAQVLKTASEKQNIDATLSAFVEASRTIQSDYDLRGVLSRALARPSLTPSVASAIFKAAVPGPGGAGIDSDYDMAELLKDAPVSMVNQPGSGWAEAVGSISSAYDRHRAIAAVLRPGASPEIVEAALTSAAGLSSDYEAANLLIEIIKAGLLTDRTSHAFMSAASHIGSAYDRRRVMEAVARTSIGDAALAEAVGAAGRISSDYDRAESLIALGRAPGVGPSSRQALNDAASAIRSDYDRGRVLAALTKAR